jgi:hypothetical protein
MRLRNFLTLFSLAAVLFALSPRIDAAPKEPAPAFATDGVAFLAKHCVQCHGDKVKKSDLTLHTFRDDAAVLKNRKTFQSVLQMVTSGEMPPKKQPRPTSAEIDAFVRSVNGVFKTAERNGKPDPGRVTIRRLNRVEYYSTVRDLVGVDFNPTEDFPADDIGHGFDNIGDVLSLSPVLMERYLAAAESIMQRAIVPNPPKPPERGTSAQYLEPAQSDYNIRWRPLDKRGNMLHSAYKITLAGEFSFRFRAYAQLSDAEPVRVAVFADDKEIKRFEVNAPKDKPVVLEVKFPMEVGDRRMYVKHLNPNGDKGRNIYVEWFNLTGPFDTRPLTQRRLLTVDASKPKAEQTKIILSRFASKAYRRPATNDEIDRLVKLVESVEKRGEKWEAGVQLAMQAVLVSPKFLFRVELDDRPQSAEPRPLDEYQLASRLSYFLWSTMPDDELLDLAGKKQLTANLDAQVRRMLKDPKAKALTENFALQWLQLRRLSAFAPDAKLFPHFNEPLRAAMLKETELFFDAVVKEDRSILDLIDADFTFLNETLARQYGFADTKGNWMGQKPTKPGGKPIRGEEFVRVEVPAERGGLLTQASVLTVTSNPTRTSPVKRGRWVLEQILGTPPPPPPPDVPELKEDSKAILTGSLRQRMEQHRANPSCANCHAKMDPIGFAFENYNAIGAYRQKDGDFAIDPAGVLPDGKSFKGPTDLKKLLKEKKELFSQCLTEKMLIYALGRGLEYYDRRTVDRIVAGLERDGYQFSTLVTEIVKSEPFRLRRGRE